MTANGGGGCRGLWGGGVLHAPCIATEGVQTA
jgi:hypothetical protein